MDNIIVTNARTHNLKNISLQIPRNKFVVITGISGSGKSSLTFDTLYAEGQRRYVESLSPYARQFLAIMDKPDCDSIEGLSPAISIEQKSSSNNPRSTVGTVTEIADYLRLLFARVGVARCPEHGTILKAQTSEQIAKAIEGLEHEQKYMLLAPIVRGRKGEFKQLLNKYLAQGFLRARIDGDIYLLEDPPKLYINKKHNIDIVVDRFVLRDNMQDRLIDSIETALKQAEGLCLIAPLDSSDNKSDILFSSSYTCPHCGFKLDELDPRNFSFNNPHGACPSCDGLGVELALDCKKVIVDASKPYFEALDNFLARNLTAADRKQIGEAAIHYAQELELKFEPQDLIDKAYSALDERLQNCLMFGSATDDGSALLKSSYLEHYDEVKSKRHFKCMTQYIFDITRVYRPMAFKDNHYHKFLTPVLCHACKGARIKKEYTTVFVNDLNYQQVSDMSIKKALDFFSKLQLEPQEMAIANLIIKEINARLHFLQNVGLEYLSLSRSANTLSGGEAQRIRLASQIGAGLVGVMYTLDEPSIGLHQRDNQKLLDALVKLRDLGNTVIVVEHDEDAIRQADFIVDIGPKAGVHGGEVVAIGSIDEILKSKNSLTAEYLSGRKKIAVPKKRVKYNLKQGLKLEGCTGNNLKNVSITIPSHTLTVVTGVSGSGKSTLINDTLTRICERELNQVYSNDEPYPYKSIIGLENFDKIIRIDQSPIGRTPRSNPATYVDFFTDIRELFAQTPEARANGFAAGIFSFNIEGGRCSHCSGDGTIKVEMHFLPDVYVKCDQCNGTRYKKRVLDVHYKGKNIAEVLDMTIEEAYNFFEAIPGIKRKLKTLLEVGLGYIKIGQSATTLSGGEAQRIKLAKELSKRSTGKTLYVLDEPTTGLHFHDIDLLLQMLLSLRDQGNTIVVIEHNLDVIKCADYIIDLGVEGGSNGGEILFSGTPEEMLQCERSYTAKYLKPILARGY